MTEDDDSTARPVSTSKPRPPSFPSSQLPLPILNKASIALQSPPQSSTTDSSPNYALPTSIQTTTLATPTTNPFFGNQCDDHLHRTHTLPSHLHQSTSSSPSSAGSLRRDRNRVTRRSADVLQHLKTLDDEVKARGGRDALAPRETKKAAITTDDVGGLVNVNQYAIIKELGRGAFAEVKLCKRQVGPMTPTPTDAAGAGAAGAAAAGAMSPTHGGGGGVGSGEYASLVSGTGSPKGGGRRGGGREASAMTTSPFFPSSTSTPTAPTSRGMTPSPTPVGDTEELFAIKIFSKSLLLRRKQFGRSREGRLNVTTDLDKVQREIAIMKKLVHPHLVSLFEVIDDASQDALYLVLEYVPGGQIMEFDAEERRYFSSAHAERGGVLGEVEAARVLGDILAGLVYLHVHHIAHRDLKPENVLVGKGGRCKIADFGVAHYFEEEAARVLALTNAPVVGGGGGEGGMEGGEKQLHQLYRSTSRGLLNKSDGTWSFWAPEMCRQGGGEGGSFSGYSCDVWATGVCLWVFVFGTLPFQEESPEELFEAIREKDFVLPEGGREGGREVSGELRDLLRAFLQKVPRDRITVGDALDHPWSQLADEEGGEEGREGGSMGVEGGDGGWAEATAAIGITLPPSTPSGRHSTLRTRAYSFQKVHVTPDEIDGAIQSVNNFVLVNKLKKRLTRKLREARASLSRVYSPAPSPDASPSASPDHSRSGTTASPVPCQGKKNTSNSNCNSNCSSSSTHNDDRRPSFVSPYSFLPPAILAAFSSVGGTAGGASPSSCCQHKKNNNSLGGSGVGSSVSASISASGGGGGGPAAPSSPSHSSAVSSRTSEEGGRERDSLSSSLVMVPEEGPAAAAAVAPVPASAAAAAAAASTANSSSSSSSSSSKSSSRGMGFSGMGRRSPKARLRAASQSKGQESCSVM